MTTVIDLMTIAGNGAAEVDADGAAVPSMVPRLLVVNLH